MGEVERAITVHVKYGEIEQTFSGCVNDVWVSVNKFFGEMVPAFDLARRVSLTVDLAKLIDDFKGVIAVASEGPEVLVPKDKLTDSEALRLFLLVAWVGFKLGKLSSAAMTKDDLAGKLGKSLKITTTRLGELVKDGSAVKNEAGDFGITTIGVKRLDEALSRIKAKLKGV